MAAARKLENACRAFPRREPIDDVPRNTTDNTWSITTEKAATARDRGKGRKVKRQS
jgi:hypothetical protein